MPLKSLLVLVFIPLFGLVIYCWLCNKLGIENVIFEYINALKTMPVKRINDESRMLYHTYKADYENFATLLFPAIIPLASSCDLVKLKDAKDLYAADLDTRIGLNNHQIVFRYELDRVSQPPLMGAGAKIIPTKKDSAQEIAYRIGRNLKNEQTFGYSVDGPIHGIELTENRIRIEIWGVNRKIIYPMEAFAL